MSKKNDRPNRPVDWPETEFIELQELELTRFGPHRSRILRFRQGINLVYGPNASGKSSVVAALYFLLTGHSIQPSSRPADHALNGSGIGELRLRFASSGKAFQLQRSTDGEVRLASLGNEETTLAATPDQSRLAVQNILGIDSHRLSLAHFLREDEVGHFLSQTAGQRKDLLRAALKLDRWERTLKVFREGRRLARAQHKELNAALRQMGELPADLDRRMATARGQLEEAEESHRTLMRSEGHESLLALSRARIRLDELQRELEQVLFPLRSTVELFSELSDLETELEHLSTIESDLAFARQNLGELLGLQQSVASDRSRLRSLVDAGDRHCPTCEHLLELVRIQGLIERKVKRLQELDIELESARERVEGLEEQIRERHEDRRRFGDLRVKREKVIHLSAEIEKLRAQVEGARRQVPGGAAQRLAELDEQILSGRQLLDRLLVEHGAVAERRVQFRVLSERRDVAKLTRLRLEAAVEGLEGALTEVAEGWFAPMERRLQSLLQGVGVLTGTSIDMHSSPMRPRVSDAQSVRDFVALSGSERALLYLCFKGALSETIGLVPFLVLDEPTVHLDPERKRRLVRLLKQLAGTRRQIVVASNDPVLLDGLAESHVLSLGT